MKINDKIFIHPTSLVETNQIGRGTHIWAFTHVLKGAKIGAQCNIGDHCFIETGVNIGDNVTVKNGNKIWEGVTLNNGAFVGPSASSPTDDLYPRSPLLPHTKARYNVRQWLVTTHIQEGATVGAGAVIIAGKRIGEFAIVCAGTVVTKNVPAHALVAGDPVRVLGWVCQCGQLLKFHNECARCEPCELTYVKHNGGIKLAIF